MCFSRFHTSVLQQQANYARNYIQVEVQDAAASTALVVNTSSGTSTWEFWSDLGLENTYTTNSSNHTWSGTTDKKVRFFPPSGDWALVNGNLNWSSKSLKGPIDPNFGLLENIFQLILNSNPALTGPLPDFKKLTSLLWLRIENCGLTGTIPDFSGMPNLRYLRLFSNSLTGSIPDFSNLPNLQDLRLNNNSLTGSIPDFSNLPNLQDLRLNNNSLTGSIPDFSNLPNLQYLYLYSNSLTGSIPDFTNLPNLQYLYLYSNSLTGSIPDIGTNHPALITCRIYSNQLSAIDTPWSISATTTEFRADGNALTTAAHINEILARANAAGALNGLLNLSGGTNAAPDGTSGGFDGITERANLIGKGWTVTTN